MRSSHAIWLQWQLVLTRWLLSVKRLLLTSPMSGRRIFCPLRWHVWRCRRHHWSAFASLAVDGTTADTPTALGVRQIVKAKSLLGDQGEKLSTIVVHPNVYYDLMERRAIDMVYDSTGAADANADSGSTANAFGQVGVPTFMGLRVIVSADVQTDGAGANTEYASYVFTPGAIGSGEQMALRTERDRDILAKSDALSFDLHYVYHPMGTRFSTSVANPTPAQLSTVGNWTKVYETNNLGIVRITSTSNS